MCGAPVEWQLAHCQAAVENVLKGHPLQMERPPDHSDCSDTKPSPSRLIDSILTDRPLKLRNRSRFKRSLHRKPTTHLEKLDDATDSQVCNLKRPISCPKDFESMFQVIQEENVYNNNKITSYPVQNIVKAEVNVEPEQFQEVGKEEIAVEEMFHSNGMEILGDDSHRKELFQEAGKEEVVGEMFHCNEMEILGDDSHGKEIDEIDVELELTLGSPASHEAVQTLQDFKLSHRHWSSQNGCKDHPLPNFTSLNLALS